MWIISNKIMYFVHVALFLLSKIWCFRHIRNIFWSIWCTYNCFRILKHQRNHSWEWTILMPLHILESIRYAKMMVRFMNLVRWVASNQYFYYEICIKADKPQMRLFYMLAMHLTYWPVQGMETGLWNINQFSMGQ